MEKASHPPPHHPIPYPHVSHSTGDRIPCHRANPLHYFSCADEVLENKGPLGGAHPLEAPDSHKEDQYNLEVGRPCKEEAEASSSRQPIQQDLAVPETKAKVGAAAEDKDGAAASLPPLCCQASQAGKDSLR